MSITKEQYDSQERDIREGLRHKEWHHINDRLIPGPMVGEPIMQSEPNRTCEGESCETVLSIYNHDSKCWTCARKETLNV